MMAGAFVRILLSALALFVGAEAQACVFLPGPFSELSPAERVIEEKRLAKLQVRQRTLSAEKAVLAGTDPAAALADMLVPNVRPILIVRTDCGPENEVDHANGEEALPAALAGTRFAGREDEFRQIVREWHPGFIGDRCSAEFRSSFAAGLRRRLTPAQLRESFLFLAGRSSQWDEHPGAVKRLMAFQGGSRSPPVRWMSDWRHQKQIRRWTQGNETGRALRAAIDAFWTEQQPRLSDDARVCPATLAQWSADRAELVRMIEDEAARRGSALRR